MAAVTVEMLKDYSKAKTGPTIGCDPGSCGVCPVACSIRQQTGEFRSGSVLTVNKLAEVPSGFRGRITFNDLQSQRSGEPQMGIGINREASSICTKCNKPASTCSHSEAYDLPKAA